MAEYGAKEKVSRLTENPIAVILLGLGILLLSLYVGVVLVYGQDPSPTPAPQLYPAVDFARWSNADDGQAGGGWPTSDIFVYFQNEPLTTAGEQYGYFDTVYSNNYVEVNNAIYAPVIVRLSEGQGTNAVIPEGAWTEVTHDGTTTKIWFPAHTLLSETSTYYYLGNNGALYHDRRLTAPAWKYAVTPTPSAPPATPTPTAIPATSPTPTPQPPPGLPVAVKAFAREKHKLTGSKNK